MVEGYAHVTVGGVTKTIRMHPLEWTQLIAERAGFSVDAEPTGTGAGWKVTAISNHGSAVVRKTGSSLLEACTKLVESLV